MSESDRRKHQLYYHQIKVQLVCNSNSCTKGDGICSGYRFLKCKEEDDYYDEMESDVNKEIEEMEKKMGVDKRDIGPPPCGPYGKPLILAKHPYCGTFAAHMKSSGTQTANICLAPPSEKG